MTVVDLVVRDARPGDAHAIAQVHVATWRAAYAALMPQHVLDGLSVDSCADMWSRLIGRPDRHLLVLAAPEVVGFASFGPGRQDPDLGELYALYLDQAWWGRGAGRLLHDAAVERLDAAHPAAMLWVLQGNGRAARFYRAAGWRPDGGVQHEERYVRDRARA